MFHSHKKRSLSMNGILSALPGSHSWIINDLEYIERIKQAQPEEKFVSSTFEIHGQKWCLLLYPNGSKDKYKGYINLLLKIMKLPPKTSKIEIKFKLSVKELNIEFDSITELTKKKTFCQWPTKMNSRYSLKKINSQITVHVEIAITKIYDHHGKTYISANPISLNQNKSKLNQQQKPKPKQKQKHLPSPYHNKKSRLHIQSSSVNDIPLDTAALVFDLDEDEEDDDIYDDDDVYDNDNNNEGDKEKQHSLKLDMAHSSPPTFSSPSPMPKTVRQISYPSASLGPRWPPKPKPPKPPTTTSLTQINLKLE